MLAAACTNTPAAVDFAGRVAAADTAFEQIAAAMRMHDASYESPLYQTRDTQPPGLATVPSLGQLATTVDSMLDALARPPADADSTSLLRASQLEAGLRAVGARIQLLSGEAVSIEEARALQDVGPLGPPPSLSLAVAMPTPAAAQPVVKAAPGSAPAGKLVIPVAGVSSRDLEDTFTQSRSEGRVHNALDIMAPRGTPVLAASEGRILRLFTSVRGGLTVYQLGVDNRTVSYYAHLERYAPGLAAGQSVTPGTLLGYVGDTGNAGAGNYHLHFAMWTTDDPSRFWDGASLNPYPLLQDATTVGR